MEKKKVTRNDLKIIDATIKVKAVEIDGKLINLTPQNHGIIENYITHDNCSCGEEFEKRFTYQKLCSNCENKKNDNSYQSLDLIEWDGYEPLFLFDTDDKYFFNLDDLLDYCSDEELEPSDLRLLNCVKSNFSPIELESICEEVTHEDWEPSKEFEDKLKEFNNWLTNQSTDTWFPGNKRVNISKFIKN